MLFPWHKYEELPISKRNTIQVFVTNQCNLRCPGCFARKEMTDAQHISIDEFEQAIEKAYSTKGADQVNLLGGEPLLHPQFESLVDCAKYYHMKVTTYTNGLLLDKVDPKLASKTKFRVSIYKFMNGNKALMNLPHHNKIEFPFDSNFMVGRDTTLEELKQTATVAETCYKCKTFFISSIRELDNIRKEFFDDTYLTMPVLKYKELVHKFLEIYEGNMEIHISKRGVFESTKSFPHNKCKFVNYFIGGKIVQCPYDVVNKKYQDDYEFDTRNCQQNNTCLMSKIVVKRRK